MQITRPDYYKEFSCIASQCPDTCCAGWQIMIDDKSLKKYQRFKGSFRNRLHNDINWKEKTFLQYEHRCAFLNDENLCDLYTEAGAHMLCDTCRRYPRHIEEFEGLREISLSLSCPEVARILLKKKEPVHFQTIEKATSEEAYEEFDYLFFTALMDTRDYLIKLLQNRSVSMEHRLYKLLACAHDFQLCFDKNELYKWEELRNKHRLSGYTEDFLSRIQKRTAHSPSPLSLMTRMWKTIVPKMEVLRPGWHTYLEQCLQPLYKNGTSFYQQSLFHWKEQNPDWEVQMEQLLIYWIFTYFCGSVYDGELFSKVKMAVVCTLFVRDLAVGSFIQKETKDIFSELVSVCYRFSRELEHSDPNLNQMDELLGKSSIFSFEHLLAVCEYA